MLLRALASTLIVASLAVAGCTANPTRPPGPGTDGGPPPPNDGGITPTGDIRIEPADHVATIMGGAPVELDYRAFVRGADGSERDVSAEVTWSVTRTELGSFAGAHFTSSTTLGGRTAVRARMGTLEGTTSLTLRLERAIVTPGTPPDAPGRFGGAVDPSRAPEIVYPSDGTMVPPNLRELELHYRPNGGTLFELHVTTTSVDLRIYFGCPESVGGGCIYTADDEVWTAIATAARGTGPFTYRLRSVDAMGRVGESAMRTLRVAEEDITGGLYYWNAGGGTIDRFEFGVRGAVAERFLDQARTGAMTCVGCHTLSRDGTRIAVGTDIPTTSLQVFDVRTRARIFMLGAGGFGGFPSQPNFTSFSPDARQLVASSLAGLSIRDATTGAVVTERLGGGASSMPDWSPDGNHIVYVRHDAPSFPGLTDTPSVTSGRIHTLDWNGTSWVAGPVLVAGGSENNYYPAYSPNGRFVVFNRSPSNTGSMGGDGSMGGVTDAQLWYVRSDGSGTAILLARATGYGDSWPKWDPTEYLDDGRPVYWLAWSSLRAYGLRYGDGARVQLWMTAFEPNVADTGGDPALPAFRLPFQNIETGNHIAQWVTRVERMTCTTDADCGGEFCVDGRCYEQPPLF